MTSIADMVERLIAAGTPAAVAAVVVTEAFAAGAASGKSGGSPVDEAAERRRAYDRDRKQRQRDEKRKSGGSPVEVPRTSATVLTLPTTSIDSEVKEGKKVRARKHPLPPDWTPKPTHFEAAAKLGILRPAVLGKAEDMKIWAGSTGALKVDWDLTFHGFLRRDAEKLAAQGKPNGKSVIAAADALVEHMRQWEKGDGPDMLEDLRGGAGPADVRVLPTGRGG